LGLCTIIAAVATIAWCNEPTPLHQAVTSLGFIPFPLPTENQDLGTVLAVKRDGGSIKSFDSFCEPSIHEPNLERVGRNATEGRGTIELDLLSESSKQGKIAIDSSGFGGLTANLSAEVNGEVQIRVVISNARVQEIDITTAERVQNSLLNSSCKEFLPRYSEYEFNIIRSLLIADIKYQISLRQGASAELSASSIKLAEATLKAKYDTLQRAFLKGTHLALGFKLNLKPYEATQWQP